MITLLVLALALLPNPPKPEMVACPHCGSKNEPDRTKCRNCQQPMW